MWKNLDPANSDVRGPKVRYNEGRAVVLRDISEYSENRITLPGRRGTRDDSFESCEESKRLVR